MYGFFIRRDEKKWPLAEVRPYFSLGIFHENKLVVLGLFYQVKSFTYLKNGFLVSKKGFRKLGTGTRTSKTVYNVHFARASYFLVNTFLLKCPGASF